MKVSDFDFDLPEECIALRPVSPKDSAKLLQVSSKGELLDYCVKDLPNLLVRGDVLVINETRVLHAALNGTRKAREYGGGGDVNLNINLHAPVSKNEWRAFIRPAKRLKIDDIVYFSDDFYAVVYDKLQNGDVGLRFNLSGITLKKAIDKFGKPPIPPYISRKRPADESDVDDYQTIYASENSGSVAAPTAGLHFTDTLFKELNLKGIEYIKQQKRDTDIVVFLDGDYSDYPEELTKIVAPMIEKNIDFIIGSRVKKLREKAAMQPQQIFGNWLATSLMTLFFKSKFTDLGPFRAIKFDTLMRLQMEDPTYGWTVEMQLKILKQKFTYEEIAVKYRNRIGVSKVSGTVKGSIFAGIKILTWIIKYSFK